MSTQSKVEHNKSRMVHSERCRTRMGRALATTEAGQKRLDTAEESMNQRLVTEVEEADARPERGIEAVGPDVGFENQQQRSDEPIPGMEPAERRSTHRGANGRRLEKSQGPSGLNGASSSNEVVVGRAPIGDWIDDDGEDMELEDGGQIPQPPEVPDSMCEPTEKAESEADMDTGMLGLLKTCSGREGLKARLVRDSEGILKLVRDLGGSVPGCKRERNKAMKGIVSAIYSTPRITKMIKMMPSSEVLVGFALDRTTCDTDGKAWNFDEQGMRTRVGQKADTEEPMFPIGSPFCTPYSPL